MDAIQENRKVTEDTLPGRQKGHQESKKSIQAAKQQSAGLFEKCKSFKMWIS